MSRFFKKLNEKEIINILDYINYSDGGIVSRAVVQRDNFSFTFFSFAAEEGIAEYAHCGDVLIHLLEGEISVSIEGMPQTLTAGDIIAVPDNTPHGIEALVPSKAVLYIVKP